MDLSENNNEPDDALKMDYEDYSQDSAPALNSKPSMFGNRRKQSKPNRIHGQDPEVAKSDRKPDPERKPFDCELCSLSHENYEDLAWHQYEAHGLIKLDKNQPEPLENTVNDDMDSEARNFSPGAKDEREPGEVTKKTGIFHMDAYCQICDREFCNKYFLQTHLANKHGVFKDLPPSPGGCQKDNPMDLSNDLEKMEKSTVSMPVSVIPTSANFSPLPLSSLSGPNFYPKIPEPYPKLPSNVRQLEYPKLSDSYPKLPDNYPKLSEAYKFLPTQEEKPKQRGIEDFCELCQKHFCNKYYLRKHKMDVHGIHSDPYSVRRRLGLSGSSERRETPIFSSPSLIPQPSPAPLMMMNPFAPMMTLPPDPMLFQRYSMPGMMGLNLSKMEDPEKRQEKEKEERRAEPREERPRPDEEARPFSHTHFIDELISKYDKNVDRRERHHGSSDGCRSDEDSKSPPKVSPKSEPAEEDNKPEAEVERTPDHPRTCDICLKVFADKYSLRMHKINIHDVHPKKEKSIKLEPPALSFPPSTMPDLRFPPLPVPSTLPPFTATTMTSSTPEFDVLVSMYGSMAAAKLADRVTCDICNKDVCNKYFLKTHKVKMHGVDPASLLDSPMKEDMNESPSTEDLAQSASATPFANLNGNLIPGVPSLTGMPLSATQSAMATDMSETENARREELLKLGIDPESYCEICRKEFCSKYFLRTHKLNMHGIPTDKPGNRKEDREISRREIMQREMMIQQSFGQIPMDYSLIASPDVRENRPGSIPSFLPSSPFKPGLKADFDVESVDSNKSDKSAKSKDPANSIRVKCELCNKELCNKYFLRTHKMKKHGIVDDVLSEGQQRKLLEMQRQGLFPIISYNGLQKGEKEEKSGSESPIANGGDFSTLCQICQESFPSLDLLHIHMFMTHGKMTKDASVCQICGLLCKDQIGLQLHMVQEHNATINITPEGTKSPDVPKSPDAPKTPDSVNLLLKTPVISRNPEPFMDNLASRRHLNFMGTSPRSDSSNEHKKRLYSCSKCPFKTRVFNHLHAHQKLKHRKDCQINVPARKFRCRNCRRRFLNRKSFRMHSARCQNRKCPNCEFSSDLKSLKLHMIMNHPQSPNAIENYAFDNCSEKNNEEFVMQKFSIADRAESNFANAFVYLPVARKVERPITVSLHLTPTDR